ncbi:5-carboxymethyl-2-hydroxymuconate Delta-isomerase [Thalassotalea euphylliae]|uniref:5-carboxymethyl-2-hydroxymuconate Delta-isomerase n=1 Tax=Thalassotalea euphylliae TaxID=1655234 RepID=A0A3E0U1I8_9GAMM|nr:5-carboxymethyl-2-hydroxymuconate Delta-isomerase [Thalassotalea euphylliae]REL30570.1 5-carboxymethyl-2-hydroxymuconate Delta-isomerase [Thalassotalea euphylliae]
MPHCIIEHASTLDSNKLVSAVFQGALASNQFEPDGSDIKVRAISFNSYQVGSNQSKKSPSDFIHITLKILSGRSEEQKQLLSKSVLNALNTRVRNSCEITIEVVDIDRASYLKAKC